MEGGIIDGYVQVADALVEIRTVLDRGTVAGGGAAGGDVEERKVEGTPSTASPAAGTRRAPTLTPVDRDIVEDLIADDVEPSDNPVEAENQADLLLLSQGLWLLCFGAEKTELSRQESTWLRQPGQGSAKQYSPYHRRREVYTVTEPWQSTLVPYPRIPIQEVQKPYKET
jgi:hypothetical protein